MKLKHILLFVVLALILFSLFGSCSIELEQYEDETTRREPSDCTLIDDTKIKQGSKASANLIIDNGTDNTTIFIGALNSGIAYNGYTFSVLGSTVDFSGNALTTSNPVDIQRSGSAYKMYVLSGVVTHQDVVNEINNFQTDFSARISSGTSDNFSVPVENLNSGWTSQGGTWNISVDGKTVDQVVNGVAVYFLSPDNRTDYLLTSTIQSTDSDNDDMGYAIGWVDNENYILFRWDRGGNQTPIGGNPPARSLEYRQSGVFTRLASDEVNWAYQQYNVSIGYTSENIQIIIDNSTIFNVSTSQFSSISSFPTGKFGFYNMSQGGVTYGNVETGKATTTSGGTADEMISTASKGFNQMESPSSDQENSMNICIVTKFDCSYEPF